MSFDLAVWAGPAPLDDQAAAATYTRLMEELEAGAETAPAPAIVAYVDGVTDLGGGGRLRRHDGERPRAGLLRPQSERLLR